MQQAFRLGLTLLLLCVQRRRNQPGKECHWYLITDGIASFCKIGEMYTVHLTRVHLHCTFIQFYNMVQRVLLFPNKKVTQIALKVLKRNAFFAHQENILLSILKDDDKMVRHLAVSKILTMRVKSNFSIETEFEASKDQADDTREDK